MAGFDFRFASPKRPDFTGAPDARPKAPPRDRDEALGKARTFRAGLRRRAQLKRAADVLPHLPGPGESVHLLMTGYYDLALLLACVIRARPDACLTMRIATLAFSSRNVEELAALIDEGKVRGLSLLCSNFMAKSNPQAFAGAAEALAKRRGARLAHARTHCKVVCLAFEDGSRLTFEGSANLRTNKNIEQLAVFSDADLHDFHAAWIDAKVEDHERREKEEAGQGRTGGA